MSRGTKKFSPIKGRRMRVTAIDSCGRVRYGDRATVVTKGQISVAYTAVTSESDAIEVTNSDGEVIAREPGKKTPTGFTAEIVMGEVDPELFAMLTGMDLMYDAFGNAVGFPVDTSVDLSGTAFALEVWTGAPTKAACDDPNAQGQFGYVITPYFTGGTLGDFTIENGAINMTITGAETRDGNAWGHGPYDVQLNRVGNATVAGPLVTALTSTQPLAILSVEIAPPAPVDGARPLHDPSVDVITSVTGTVDGREVTFGAVPDPDANTGVEYDFGDGTWDYVLGGDAVHEYEAAGTYTVRATTNGTWVQTTVTVA